MNLTDNLQREDHREDVPVNAASLLVTYTHSSWANAGLRLECLCCWPHHKPRWYEPRPLFWTGSLAEAYECSGAPWLLKLPQRMKEQTARRLSELLYGEVAYKVGCKIDGRHVLDAKSLCDCIVAENLNVPTRLMHADGLTKLDSKLLLQLSAWLRDPFVQEYKTRETIYLSALVNQEAEMSQLRGLASEILGAFGDQSLATKRGALADSTANMEVLMLRQQARAKEHRLNQLKDDVEANRFDQSNADGKALMQKCKALLSENRELGELMREERLADLRVALQNEQRKNAEFQQKCEEAVEFCKELGQDSEKLQASMAKVAGDLLQAKNELEMLRRQRHEARVHRKQAKLQRQQAERLAAEVQSDLAGVEIPGGIVATVEVVDDDEEPLRHPPVREKEGGEKEKKSKKRKAL
ncbi:Pre-mRNA-splicing regulator female-lethal(2)D [Symbiodinium microadriaticum]|uniref:Pre-mRNA-splicing regulator female-lethal(2)D n=1 Tax=Symbiodinium microadriaticum TaxID=2951 RepID=A0A1Q9E8J3_SYMMI|nr:Pre-mRNA-splicing regulator female-lethal(2)D [Symbiodinium microadriaticum]